MYCRERVFVKPNMKMFDIIEQNPSILLMLQHFEVDFLVGDKTVEQICIENNISERLFLTVTNLYNGTKPKENPFDRIKDVEQIIIFLKNSHNYYRDDKYPQISSYIRQLQEKHPKKELKMLENFFNEYFTEVIEHLNYEDEVAFPYFLKLINSKEERNKDVYSAKEYSDHHSDIELKLNDFKNLLLKYVDIHSDLNLRRKLLFALFELEYDLYIHSLIEETILIPFGYNIEKGR